MLLDFVQFQISGQRGEIFRFFCCKAQFVGRDFDGLIDAAFAIAT